MSISLPFIHAYRKPQPALTVKSDKYEWIENGQQIVYHPATAPWLSFDGAVLETDKAEQLAFISYVSTGSSGRYLVMTGWVTPNELDVVQ